MRSNNFTSVVNRLKIKCMLRKFAKRKKNEFHLWDVAVGGSEKFIIVFNNNGISCGPRSRSNAANDVCEISDLQLYNHYYWKIYTAVERARKRKLLLLHCTRVVVCSNIF